MQNDDEAHRAVEKAISQKNEERRKQLALLLQRRQQLRHTTSIATDITTPVSTLSLLTTSSQADTNQLEKAIPRQSFALVVASYSFRNLPALSEKTKDVASSLFDSLVNQHFNRFSRRGSRLLLNPSVIEFQDTMKELKKICAEEPDSSFFMCLSTHGARVTHGAKEGSYVLFSETRLSSEEELVLTAIHERELAEMIHDIPCKNKFVALELCQTQEPKEKKFDDAETIHYRIHEHFFSQLYKQLVKLRHRELLNRGVRLATNEVVTEEAVRTNPKLLNLILMESCNAKHEVPVRSNDECVSNFLLRFRDAFRGAAVIPKLDEDGPLQSNQRRPLFVKEVLAYVSNSVREDAAKHNAFVYAEYKGQVRTRYEHAAEFQDITHTTGVLGADHASDFGMGEIPEPPTVSPTPPTFVASTLNSIRLTWNFTAPSTNTELPIVLGYHVQRRGHGPACADGTGEASNWKRAAALQVLSYEDVVRNAKMPSTTITAYGLSSDTAYCFRVRARTTGGWGPFSEISPGYRTLSAASTQDLRETIRLTAFRDGARGVMNLMTKYSNSGPIQRYAAGILAIMAIAESSVAHVAGGNKGLRPLKPSDLPVVLAVRNAMQKFKRDMHLHQQGCLLFGRLAAVSDTWQAALLSISNPSLLQVLHSIASRIQADNNHELTRCANWAIAQFQEPSKTEHRVPEMSSHDAAIMLQKLYRCRKARDEVRALAQVVYSQAIDPVSGIAYVFNTRTGATFWTLPWFAI